MPSDMEGFHPVLESRFRVCGQSTKALRRSTNNGTGRRIHHPDPGCEQRRANFVYFGIAPSKIYPFDLRYDNHGFRNEQDVRSAEGIVIGDSFIEANTIATQDMVVKQLKRLLGLTTANLAQVSVVSRLSHNGIRKPRRE